jgi:hypothetical protein
LDEKRGPDAFDSRCTAAESGLEGAIERIHMFGLRKRVKGKADAAAGEPSPGAQQGVLVLISHTNKGKLLAEALNGLLHSALGLLPSQTRCSNVNEYWAAEGVNTQAHLREVNGAKLLIGLITPRSLSSGYVLFELGARLGAGLPMIPLLAGGSTNELRGPLSFLNAASGSEDADLHQLLRDVGQQLKMTVQSPGAYQEHLRSVKELAAALSAAVPEPQQRRPSSAGSTHDLRISFKIDGTPPSPQVIKVRANQPVTISCLECLLPDERRILTQECSLEGESIDLPLSRQCIDELYNAPRPAGSTYDGSVKFRVTASAGGKTRTYTFPACVGAVVDGGTVYRQAIGSKDFVVGA